MTGKLPQALVPVERELSGREKEVLVQLAQGLTNKRIAEVLGISPGTVKRHIENIYERLGISTRAQAAAFAVGHRLLDLEVGGRGEINPHSSS